MSKMGSHDPFEHLKHKLWPKEGLGIKLVVWFPPTKSWESTWFPYVQVACNISFKISQQGLQFCIRSYLNRRSTHKVMGPKVAGVPTLRISGFPFGSPRTKYHLDVGLMERRRVYCKGEGDGFPKSEPWWVLWVRVCLWLVLALKVFKLCTNQLIVWFVQIHVSH
jgi:hypothetical protein